MSQTAPTESPKRTNPQTPVVMFGIGMAALVLYLVTYKINVHTLNDFYREAWPPYQRLSYGHLTEFLRTGPAYIGSLVLRAPFALLAALFGAGSRVTYIFTALPCLVAPAVFAGWLVAADPRKDGPQACRMGRFGLRPLDLFMLTPPAVVCAAGGHPEEVLGAVLCVLAVLLARRGSGKAAGFVIGVAVINKTSAVVAVPLVFAVMPADRRLGALVTAVLTAATVLVPVTLIRASSSGGAGSALGTQTAGIFVQPQLLWWLGRDSWFVLHAHVLLVVVDWLVTAAWWWLRVRGRSEPPRPETVLMALALVCFLRGALDPWDNMYYFTPFMLAVATLENPHRFPKLTWIYVVLLVVVVPISGVLHGLGSNGQAAAFAALAVPTVAFFAMQAFLPGRTASRRVYAAASRSPT